MFFPRKNGDSCLSGCFMASISRLCRPNLCCFLQSQGLYGLLAQDEFLHLATGSQGIGFYELEVAGYLLMANLALTVCAKLCLAEVGASAGNHYGKQFFAKELIGNAGYLHIGDLWMANQKFLDLGGEDIFATANDHILQATHDV